MVTPLQSKAELSVLADDAEDTARWMLRRTSGQWESRRLQLLDTVPGVVGFYSEGSAALAADLYDDTRAGAKVKARYAAVPVILDRTVRIRRGIAWASEPLQVADADAAAARLSEVVRSEMTRPYRDTIIMNRRRDPEAVGWKRVTSAGACGFCRMLASRGAVYRHDRADFAAHENCGCTCAPVFGKDDVGPEANVIQYMASKRRKTPEQREKIRDYIASNFPDEALRPHVKTSR